MEEDRGPAPCHRRGTGPVRIEWKERIVRTSSTRASASPVGGADALGVSSSPHGASGIGDEDIKKAISCGIAKINIHTELCDAAMDAIRKNTDASFLELERAVRQAVRDRAKYKIELFGDADKADLR